MANNNQEQQDLLKQIKENDKMLNAALRERIEEQREMQNEISSYIQGDKKGTVRETSSRLKNSAFSPQAKARVVGQRKTDIDLSRSNTGMTKREHDFLTSSKKSSAWDTETIGELGSDSFALVETAVKDMQGQVYQYFHKISGEAAKQIQQDVEKIKKGQSHLVSESGMMAIKRMGTYSMDSKGKISSNYTDLSSLKLDKNSKFLDTVLKNVDIFQGKKVTVNGTKGVQGQFVTQKEMNAIQKLISDGYAYNAPFDVNVMRTQGVNAKNIIDLQSIAKKMYKIGDMRDGRMLGSYSQGSLAKWLGIDLKNQSHIGANDADVLSQIMQVIQKEYQSGGNKYIPSPASQKKISSGQIIEFEKGLMRQFDPYSYVKNKDGSIEKYYDDSGKAILSKFYEANRLINKNNPYIFKGRETQNREGVDIDYTVLEDMITGQLKYIAQSEQQFQDMMSSDRGTKILDASGYKIDPNKVLAGIKTNGYGYSALKGIFEGSRSGKRTPNRQGQYDVLRGKGTRATNVYKEAEDIYKKLSVAKERYGFSDEELDRIVSETFGAKSGFSIENLEGLGLSQGRDRVDALLRILNSDKYFDKQSGERSQKKMDEFRSAAFDALNQIRVEGNYGAAENLIPLIEEKISKNFKGTSKSQNQNIDRSIDDIISQYAQNRVSTTGKLSGKTLSQSLYDKSSGIKKFKSVKKNEENPIQKILSGTYLKDKYGNVSETSRYQKGKFDERSMGGIIDKIAEASQRKGEGFGFEVGFTGRDLTFSFYDPEDSSKVITKKIPTLDENGEVIYGSMKRPGMGFRRFDPQKKQAYIQSVSEVAAEQIKNFVTGEYSFEDDDGNVITGSGFSSMISGPKKDLYRADKTLDKIMSSVFSTTPTLGGASVKESETSKYVSEATTPEQKALRNGLLSDAPFMADLMAYAFGGNEFYQGKDVKSLSTESAKEYISDLQKYMVKVRENPEAEFPRSLSFIGEDRISTIKKAIKSTVKNIGDRTTMLKEEATYGDSLTNDVLKIIKNGGVVNTGFLSSTKGADTYTAGGKHYFDRSLEQGASGTAMGSDAARRRAKDLLGSGVVKRNKAYTKDYAGMYGGETNFEEDPRNILWNVQHTTDEDFYNVVKEIAENREGAYNKEASLYAQKLIKSGTLPSVENDSSISLLTSKEREALQTYMPVTKTFSDSDSKKWFESLLGKKGISLEDFKQNKKKIKLNKDDLSGIPIKNGKPLFKIGDILSGLEIGDDNTYKIMARRITDLGEARGIIGGNTKTTIRPFSGKGSDEFIQAIRNTDGYKNAQFLTKSVKLSDARKVNKEAVERITSLYNMAANIGDNGEILENLKKVKIVGDKTFGELFLDKNGYFKNEFGTDDISMDQIANAVLGNNDILNQAAVKADDTGKLAEWYNNGNNKLLTYRTTQATDYFKSRDNGYKFGTRANKVTELITKKIGENSDLSKKRQDLYQKKYNQMINSAPAERARRYIESIDQAVGWNSGVRDKNDTFLDILGPNEYYNQTDSYNSENSILANDLFSFENALMGENNDEDFSNFYEAFSKQMESIGATGARIKLGEDYYQDYENPYTGNIERRKIDSIYMPYIKRGENESFKNTGTETEKAAFRVAQAVKTGDKGQIYNAVSSYYATLNNEAYSKEGILRQLADESYAGHSTWQQITGNNLSDNAVNESGFGDKASYAIFNNDQLKHMLIGYNEELGQDLSDESAQKNLRDLVYRDLNNYISLRGSKGQAIESFNKRAGTYEGFINKDGSINEGKLNSYINKKRKRSEIDSLRNTIASRVVELADRGKYGDEAIAITGKSSRNPEESSIAGQFATRFYSSSTVEPGHAIASNSLLGLQGGDLDGDTIDYIIESANFKYNNFKDYQNVQDAIQERLDYADRLATSFKIIQNNQSSKPSDSKIEEIEEKYKKIEDNTKIANDPKAKMLAEIKKQDKSYVGAFSRRYSQYKNTLRDAGLYTGDNSIDAFITSALLQTPAEEGMVTKHAIEKYAENPKLDPSEITTSEDIWESLNALSSNDKGDRYSEESLDRLIENFVGAGFATRGEDGQIWIGGGKGASINLASVIEDAAAKYDQLSADKKNEIPSSATMEESIRNKALAYFKSQGWEDDEINQLMAGKISASRLKQSYGNIDSIIRRNPQIGGEGFGLAGAAWQLSQQDTASAVTPDESFRQLTRQAKKMYGRTGSEKNVEYISAEDLNAQADKEKGELNGAGFNTSNVSMSANQVNINASNVNLGEGPDNGNAGETGNDNSSVTNAQFRQLVTSDGKHNYEGLPENVLSASKIASTLAGKNKSLWVEEYGEKAAADMGTYIHSQLEDMGRAKDILKGTEFYDKFDNLTSLKELEDLLDLIDISDSNNDLSANQKSKIEALRRKRVEERESFEIGIERDNERKRAMGQEATSQEEINEIIRRKTDTLIAQENAFVNAGNERIANEVSMSGKFGKHTVAGTADTIYWNRDTGTLTVGDTKSGAFHPEQAAIQESILSRLMQSIYGDFKNQDFTKNLFRGMDPNTVITDDIMEKIKGTSLYQAASKDNLLGDQAENLFRAFSEMYLREQSGGKINWGLMTNTNGGKDNGYGFIQGANRIREDKMNALVTRAARGESLSQEELEELNYSTRGGRMVTTVDDNTKREDALEFLKEYNNLLKERYDLELEIAKIQQLLNNPSTNQDERKSLFEQLNSAQESLGYTNQMISEQKSNRDALMTSDVLTDSDKSKQQYKENKYEADYKVKVSGVREAKKELSLIDELFSNFQRQLKYMTTQSLVYKAIGGVQQAIQTVIQTVKQLDAAMVDLQIASGNTREELVGSMGGFNQIAQDMGRTTQDVLSAANDWLRAGYSIEEANTLIRDSMKLSTLGMIDSDEATKDLISTMKGWKLSAGEVSQVVDELTALDMAAATSAGEIAEMMSYGNTSAMMAGTTRQNYEAYLTTAADVSQMGASTVGNAMKTVFARYGNVKAGKYAKTYNSGEEAGEDGEFTALNDVETVLNKIGIATRNSVSEFRDIDEVFEDIAAKWSGLDEVSRNAVTTALGGTRQREVLNVLFGNWDEVENLRKVAGNSEGTADAKMPAYLDSIQAAQNRLTTAIEGWATRDRGFLGIDYTSVLSNMYNMLANIVQQADKIVLLLAAYVALSKGKQIGSTIGGFINGYNNRMDTIRQNWHSGIERGYNRYLGLDADWKKGIIPIPKTPEKAINNYKKSLIEEKENQIKEREDQINNLDSEDWAGRAGFKIDTIKIKNKIKNIENRELTRQEKRQARKQYRDEAKKARAEQRIENTRQNNLSDFSKTITSRAAELQAETKTQLGLKKAISTDQYEFAKIHINDIADQTKYGDKSLKDLFGLSENDWIGSAEAVDKGLYTKYLKDLNAFGPNPEDETAKEELNQSRKELARQLGIDADKVIAEGQSVDELIKKRGLLTGALTEDANEGIVQGANGDQIRSAGAVATDSKVREAGKKLDNKTQSKDQGRSDAILSGVGMVSGAVGTTMTTAHAQGSGMSDSTASLLSLGTSLAPMIGGAIGGPIGTAIGGGISAAVGLITAAVDAFTVTAEESAQALSELSESSQAVKDKIDALQNIKDKESELKTLAKGVDYKTGANISLTDAEYQDYTEILTEIASQVAGVYTVTDSNGNTVAKIDGQTATMEQLLAQIKTKLGGEIQDTAKEQYDSNENGKIDSEFKEKAEEAFKGDVGKNGDYTVEDFKNLKTGDGKFQSGYGKSIYDLIEDYKDEFGFTDKDLEKKENREKIANKIKRKHSLGGSYDAVTSWENNGYAENVDTSQTDKAGQEAATLYMQGTNNYKYLTTEGQSYLGNLVSGFGAGMTAEQRAAGYTPNQEKLKTGMEALVSWASGEGATRFVGMQNFDFDTATSSEVEEYKGNLESMLEAVTADMDDKTKAIVEQSFYKRAGFIKDEEATGKEDDPTYKTQKEMNYKTLKGESDGKILGIDELTDEQIGYLYKNKNLINASGLDLTNKTAIANFIANQTLDSTSTLGQISQSFRGYVESDSGKKFADNQAFVNFLQSDEGKKYRQTASWDKMKEGAASIGLEIENPDDLQKYLDNMELYANVDLRFQTNESLKDIENKYKDLSEIFKDIENDGQLSLSNMYALLDQFGDEVLDVLDDPEALAEKIEDLTNNKAGDIARSINTTYAESKRGAEGYLNSNGTIQSKNADGSVKETIDVRKETGAGKVTDLVRSAFKFAGSINNLMSLGEKFTSGYDIMGRGYFKGEDGDYSGSQFVLDVADVLSNGTIDTSDGMNEEEQTKLLEIIVPLLQAIGVELSDSTDFGAVMGDLQGFLYGDYDGNRMKEFYAQAQAANKYNIVRSENTANSIVEQEEWNEKYSDTLNRLQKQYANGTISAETYKKGLQDLMNSGKATEEQMEDLAEALEDVTFDAAQYQYSLNSSGKGARASQYRNELRGLMSQNVEGSEDWIKYRDEFLQTYKDAVDYDQKASSVYVDDDDYAGKRNYQDKIAQDYVDMASAYIAAGFDRNSPEVLDALQGYQDAIKAKSQSFVDEINQLHTDYQQGFISGDKYAKSAEKLIDMASEVGLTTQQFKDLNEAIEDYYETLYSRQLSMGDLSIDDYLNNMVNNVLSRNVQGSEDYYNTIQSMVGAMDQQMQINQYKRDISKTEYDYDNQLLALNEDFDTLAKKISILMAFGWSEDSPDVLAIEAQMAQKIDEKQEVYRQEITDAGNLYNQGYLSEGEYASVLKQIANSDDLTAETTMQINETLEDLAEARYERDLSHGTYGSIYGLIGGYIKDVVNKNQPLSQDWWNSIDKIPGMFTQDISKRDRSTNITTSRSNYAARAASSTASIAESMSAIALLTNTLVRDPETGELKQLYSANSDEIISLKESILQALNEQTEAFKNWNQQAQNDYTNGFDNLASFGTNLELIKSALMVRVATGMATKDEVVAFKESVTAFFNGKFDEYFAYGKSGVSQGSFEKQIQTYLDGQVYGQGRGPAQIKAWEQAEQYYDRWYQYNENKMSLLDEDNYASRRSLIDKNIDTIKYSELSNAIHIFGRDSEQTQKVLMKLADQYKKEEEFVGQQMSQVQQDYERGFLSMSDASSKLEQIASDAKFLDSKKEAEYQKKQWYSDYYMNYAKYDKLSYDQIIQGYMDDVMSKNVYKSKGYYEGLQNWFSLMDQQIENSLKDIEFLNKDDYEGKKGIYTDSIELLKKEYQKAVLLEGEDSETAKEIALKIKDIYEKMNEFVNEQISINQEKYNKGFESDKDYLSNLEQLLKTENLSTEQRENILEAIEDLKSEVIKREYSLGKIDYKTAADQYAREVVNNNVAGSADYYNEVYNWQGIIDQGVNDILNRATLIDQGTKTGRDQVRNIIKEAIGARKQEYIDMRNAGWEKDSPDLIKVQQDLIDAYNRIAQITQEALGEAENKYTGGQNTIQEWYNEVQGIKDEGIETIEQLRAINKSTQGIYSEILNYGIEYGQYDYDSYREGFRKDIINSGIEKNTGDWFQAIAIYLQSYDQQRSNLSLQETLLEKDDYESRLKMANEKAAISAQKVASAKAAGMSDDSDTVLQGYNEILDAEIEKDQILQDIVNSWKEDYSIGKIGQSQLSKNILDLIDMGNLTAEQMKTLTEALEQTNFDLLKADVKYGNKDEETFRKELIENFISQNEVDSEQWRQYVDELINSFESENSALDVKKETIGKSNTKEQLDITNIQLENLKEEQKTIEAAALKRAEYEGQSQEAAEKSLATNQKYLSVLKQQLDLEKERAQILIDEAESVMDAYNTLSEYAINLFDEEKDSMNEFYDLQISKLEEVNKQKQNSIELTKLQQELENAQKEKTRVYQAGVGFVYLQNRGKIKEAKQNLDNYYDEQRIDSLKIAQEKSNKYFDDLIKNWQDIRKMVDKVSQNTEAQQAVNDLINRGIISGGSNIGDALNEIMGRSTWSVVNENLDGYFNGADGVKPQLISLGDSFNRYANQYNQNSLALQRFEDLGIKADTDNIDGVVNLKDETVVALADSLSGEYTVPLEDVNSNLEEIKELVALMGMLYGIEPTMFSGDQAIEFQTAKEKAAKDIGNAEGGGLINGSSTIQGAIVDSSNKVVDSAELMRQAIADAVNSITEQDRQMIESLKNGTAALGDVQSIEETLSRDLNEAANATKTSTGVITNGISNLLGAFKLNTQALGFLTENEEKVATLTGLIDGKIPGLIAALSAVNPEKMTDKAKNNASDIIKDGVQRILGNFTGYNWGQFAGMSGKIKSIKEAVMYSQYYGQALADQYWQTSNQGNAYGTSITNKRLADWFAGAITPGMGVKSLPSGWDKGLKDAIGNIKIQNTYNTYNSDSASSYTNREKSSVASNTATIPLKIYSPDGKGGGSILNYSHVSSGTKIGKYSATQTSNGVKYYITTNNYAISQSQATRKSDGYVYAYVNGTAYAYGTQGNWGAKKTEDSLVGELGPELLIRNGHYQILGVDSAGMANIRKGDVIFNADQTSQIMKYGSIIRGKRRGKAYASGSMNELSNTQSAMLNSFSSNPSVVNGIGISSDLSYLNIRSKSNNVGSDNYGETYVFNGDLNLPNVKDPSNFMSELLDTANRRFNVINKRYRR